MKRIGVISLIALAGCHHAPPRPEPPRWYIGKPLDAVVAQMKRYPESQRDFEGLTIYTWTVNELETRFIVGKVHQQCAMDVATKDKVVTLVTYNGSSGGCSYLEADIMRGHW